MLSFVIKVEGFRKFLRLEASLRLEPLRTSPSTQILGFYVPKFILLVFET